MKNILLERKLARIKSFLREAVEETAEKGIRDAVLALASETRGFFSSLFMSYDSLNEIVPAEKLQKLEELAKQYGTKPETVYLALEEISVKNKTSKVLDQLLKAGKITEEEYAKISKDVQAIKEKIAPPVESTSLFGKIKQYVVNLYTKIQNKLQEYKTKFASTTVGQYVGKMIETGRKFVKDHPYLALFIGASIIVLLFLVVENQTSFIRIYVSKLADSVKNAFTEITAGFSSGFVTGILTFIKSIIKILFSPFVSVFEVIRDDEGHIISMVAYSIVFVISGIIIYVYRTADKYIG